VNPVDAPFYPLPEIESTFLNSKNIFSSNLIILHPDLPQKVSYVFELCRCVQACGGRREEEIDFRDGGGESCSGSSGAEHSEKITRVSAI